MEFGVGGVSIAPTDPELQPACSASGLGSSLLDPQVKCKLLFWLGLSSSAVFWASFSFRAEPMITCSHCSQEETTVDLIEGSVQIKQIEHSGTGIFLLWRQVAEAE